MAVQPRPQVGAFAFSAAPFARPVVEGTDEFGDGFADRTAAQFSDGLLQPGQCDGGTGTRQPVQAEEIGEGLALGVVERTESHLSHGAAGGEPVVDRAPEEAEFGAAHSLFAQGRFTQGGFRMCHPTSRSVPFQTKRALVTASSSPSVTSWWTAMPGSSP